jgi:hypothetical protein
MEREREKERTQEGSGKNQRRESKVWRRQQGIIAGRKRMRARKAKKKWKSSLKRKKRKSPTREGEQNMKTEGRECGVRTAVWRRHALHLQ